MESLSVEADSGGTTENGISIARNPAQNRGNKAKWCFLVK
jgi:hypothetical protein